MKKGQVVEGIVKEIQFPNKGMVEVEGEERKVIIKKCPSRTEGKSFCE